MRLRCDSATTSRRLVPLVRSRGWPPTRSARARGAPSADILPAEAVREAAARALASDWERALSYGTGIGHPALCEWIASELHGIDAGQVMVTNGSMEAAALSFATWSTPATG